MSSVFRVAVSLGVMMASLAPAFAAEPVDERAVAELVSRLNAPSRAAREAAERDLLELGPKALGALPDSSSDPAIDAALQRIRDRLLSQRAIGRVTEPTRISIVGAGPLGEVAADWLDGAGRPRIALTDTQKRRPVTLDQQDVPYWRAMDRLGEEAELWPDGWNRAEALTFRERTAADMRKKLDYPGTFRVAGGPLTTKNLPGEAGEVLYRLPLAIRSEPGVRPLFIMYAAKSGSLQTDDGENFKAYTPGAKYELPVGRAGGTARLRLDFAGADVTDPLTFEGQFRATIASREAAFSFKIAREAFRLIEKKRGGVTVRLRDVQWTDESSVEVVAAVVYADGDPFESYRTWVYHNDAVVKVKNQQGEVLRIDHEPSFETVAESPGALLLRYRFEKIPEPAGAMRFEYRAPTDVMEVPLDVRLEGLPIP